MWEYSRSWNGSSYHLSPWLTTGVVLSRWKACWPKQLRQSVNVCFIDFSNGNALTLLSLGFLGTIPVGVAKQYKKRGTKKWNTFKIKAKNN